jgi:predicted CopG family antitoxin
MLSRSRRVTISPDLYERLVEFAAAQGYASVEECITHILERATARLDQGVEEAEAERQLRGLGYLE